MNKLTKVLCTLFILTTLVVPASAVLQPIRHSTPNPSLTEDFDPLDDHIMVTVTVNEIRALKTIDLLSNPDFYLKVTINGVEFISDVWENMMYVENPNWSASLEVPKDVEFVNVTIALWDDNIIVDRLCDISPDEGSTLSGAGVAHLTYSIAAGIWWGDDHLGDSSGYGRLSGCDDGTIYEQDRDCELWFDITQTDYDGDGLPYWLETTMYNTSPLVDNRGQDADNDRVPIEWEHTFGLTYYDWGYDQGYYLIYYPFSWENHSSIDSDEDGLNDIEEYKTWQWGSDPFRQDLFVEIDQMDTGPNNETSSVPVESFDMIRDSYAKHNVVWHVDDGRLGGGGDRIPFKETVNQSDLSNWYWDYFMHQDEYNWRRGVFHWGIISYNWSWAKGFCFSSRINESSAIDCFFLSAKYHDSRVKNIPLIDSLVRKTFDSEKQRALIYAGAIMHELGHSLSIWNRGVDNRRSVWPWQLGYWRFSTYKSVMNYRYIYTGLVDYSDGSHGKLDFNDWEQMDLTYFNPRATSVEAISGQLLYQ
jgi:hypothetical protein